MSEKFTLVKGYVIELGLRILSENLQEELLIVEDPENGIQNLIIDCESPILILEQLILEIPPEMGESFYKRLLQMNRNLVHGAFVLDEEGKYLLFRDTLQLENLDLNELEGTIQALSLALAENATELLGFSAKK